MKPTFDHADVVKFPLGSTSGEMAWSVTSKFLVKALAPTQQALTMSATVFLPTEQLSAPPPVGYAPLVPASAIEFVNWRLSIRGVAVLFPAGGPFITINPVAVLAVARKPVLMMVR